MLPKFLIADNSQEQPDNVYVVHTEKPRFIAGTNFDDMEFGQDIVWIDQEPSDIKVINQLIKDAEDFLVLELDNQEMISDDEDE